MRIATAIISSLMSVLVFFQTMLVGGLSEVAGDEAAGSAAAIGLLGSLIVLLSGALVISFPRASMIMFVIAAIAFFSGASSFPDLGVYGFFTSGFALMSFIGWRGKRKSDAKKRDQEALMQQFLMQQTARAGD